MVKTEVQICIHNILTSFFDHIISSPWVLPDFPFRGTLPHIVDVCPSLWSRCGQWWGNILGLELQWRTPLSWRQWESLELELSSIFLHCRLGACFLRHQISIVVIYKPIWKVLCIWTSERVLCVLFAAKKQMFLDSNKYFTQESTSFRV